MLTPAFDLSQDNSSVTICIRVPYAKISDIHVYFEDYDFMFNCKPYYLRLNLPGKVVPEDEPPVSYDVDKGTITIQMKKVNPGEQFEDLDLITKLLAPRGKPSSSSPLIEVISDSNCSEENCAEDADEFDWFIEQTPATDDDVLFLGNTTCGFANLHSSCVFKLKEECKEIFEIVDLERKPAELHRERILAESKQFSYDHYLADLYEDEEIQSCLMFSPEWVDLWKKVVSSPSHNPDEIVHFTPEEKERLRRLPNKEYLLDKSEIQTLYFGLIDILFAYAYDKRTTLGEQTVESGWTVNKLSSTLSWLEKFTSLQSVVCSCVRRSLCYPLYRHWELAMTVLNDTKKILSFGRKYVLKCLLEIHRIFCASDPRHILNDLYITDYCVWIQSKSCKTKVFLNLAEALGKVRVTKQDMNLDLTEYEQGAELAMQEHNSARVSPSVSDAHHSSFTNGSSNNISSSDSYNSSCSVHEKSGIESVTSRLEDMSISDGGVQATEASMSQTPSSTSGATTISSDVTTRTDYPFIDEKTQSSAHIVIHMPSLDPTVQNSDDSSESESSSDSCSDTVTDSDESSSSSSDSYSDDSDADSTCSNNSNEHSRLLRKENSYERRR